MTEDELAKFMQEVNELNAAYESAAKDDKQVSQDEEYEDPSDYVGMGWVDSRGRP
jgi:hypothetical protein